uniref:MAM domain-containing protein n=1 Tax=Syphacia muris TaxID=451379 RepID=A0A0N5ALB3_9BILA
MYSFKTAVTLIEGVGYLWLQGSSENSTNALLFWKETESDVNLRRTTAEETLWAFTAAADHSPYGRPISGHRPA